MMMNLGYTLNYDGILFYTSGANIMGARDQLGRIMGDLTGLTGDDETLEPGEKKLLTEDSLFAHLVASSLHSTDVEDDEGYEDDGKIFCDEDLCTQGEYLWEDEIEDAHLLKLWFRWQSDLTREEVTASWVARRYAHIYPELWTDQDEIEIEEVSSSTMQSSAQCDHQLKKLYDRSIIRSDNHGYRGRSKYRWDQKGRKSRRDCKLSWRNIAPVLNQEITFEEILEAA